MGSIMRNNNDEAMKNYFDSMLCPEINVKSTEIDVATKPNPEEIAFKQHIVLAEKLVFSSGATEENPAEAVEMLEEWQNLDLPDEFQALFFELNNVTFAIPLVDLGGIQYLNNSINSLLGKPAWFSGVISHNDKLFNVVDTALWLRQGCDATNLNYSHYVLLGSTPWGLCCEKLLGTEKLTKEQVRWRDKKGARPWLAGMVKKKMCALIHVEELVKLLDQGIDIQG